LKTAYVYVLASKRNGNLYVGVSTDLQRRVYSTVAVVLLVLPENIMSTGWYIL
jgi:hypothetical protein